MKQRTILKPTKMAGQGLHNGQLTEMELLPAPEDTGISFIRTDLPNQPHIKVQSQWVQDTLMSTNLIKNYLKIGTIEHLMSALIGLGIDNLQIRLSGSEIPILDGSAKSFAKHILQTGIKEQNKAKAFLKILKPIKVAQDDKWVELLPHHGYEINFDIDFNHPAIAKQRANLIFSSKNFIEQISFARTFGFLKDVEYLQKNNLAKGGNLNNTIVLDDTKVLNAEGLRYPNELVRHKILDALGDFFVIGYPLLAKLNAHKSGHALNDKLVKTVLSQPDCFEIVTFDDKESCPIDYELAGLLDLL